MATRKILLLCFSLSCVMLAPPVCQAQFAVVDVGAILRLIQQLQVMREQLETTRDQLEQMRRQVEAITGRRGMERLLERVVRNYLPEDWQELEAVIRGAAGNGLSAELNALVEENAVLSEEQVAALAPEDQVVLERSRRNIAVLQVLTRNALANTSARFDELQELIDAIGEADDQKAILELQARIAAEQSMLANEQSKLGILYQVAQAEDKALRQRAREQAVLSFGSYSDLPPLGLLDQ